MGTIIILVILGMLIVTFFALAAFNVQIKNKYQPDNITIGRKGFAFWGIGFAIIMAGFWFFSGYHETPERHFSLEFCFSKIDDEAMPYAPGSHLISPWCELKDFSSAESIISFGASAKQENAPLTADSVRIGTTVQIPIALNAIQSKKIYAKYGENWEKFIMDISLNSAVPKAFSKFYWEMPTQEICLPTGKTVDGKNELACQTEPLNDEKYISIKNRSNLANEINNQFKSLVYDRLLKTGLFETEAEAEEAFTIGFPQIGKVTPPESVHASIELDKQAEATLKRQKKLTEIADEVANRREKEGSGISKLLSQIPGLDLNSLSPADFATIFNAISTNTNAEANQTNAEALAVMAGNTKDGFQAIYVSPGTPVAAK